MIKKLGSRFILVVFTLIVIFISISFAGIASSFIDVLVVDINASKVILFIIGNTICLVALYLLCLFEAEISTIVSQKIFPSEKGTRYVIWGVVLIVLYIIDFLSYTSKMTMQGMTFSFQLIYDLNGVGYGFLLFYISRYELSKEHVLNLKRWWNRGPVKLIKRTIENSDVAYCTPHTENFNTLETEGENSIKSTTSITETQLSENDSTVADIDELDTDYKNSILTENINERIIIKNEKARSHVFYIPGGSIYHVDKNCIPGQAARTLRSISTEDARKGWREPCEKCASAEVEYWKLLHPGRELSAQTADMHFMEKQDENIKCSVEEIQSKKTSEEHSIPRIKQETVEPVMRKDNSVIGRCCKCGSTRITQIPEGYRCSFCGKISDRLLSELTLKEIEVLLKDPVKNKYKIEALQVRYKGILS